MTELELIVDLHKHSQRQGPGSESETLRALGFMDLPNHRKVKIADIGCGTGSQTLTLAQHANSHIIAVDLFSEFLDELKKKSQELGLANEITSLQKSMDDLPFQKEEFDIIWSEGAIYNMGFEKGIKNWKKFLKVGGYLAVSEITWLTDSRPKEIENFWARECPEIDTAANKIKILEKNDFTLVGFFPLAQASWIDNYYTPLTAIFENFLTRNHSSKLAKKVVDEYNTEIDLYMKFKDFYGYGFYVARKNE